MIPEHDNPPAPSPVCQDATPEEEAEPFDDSNASFDASPYRALYHQWNRLTDIPGSLVNRLVDAQATRFDQDIADKLVEKPAFISTVQNIIDRLAHNDWFLGITKHKDGSSFKMQFATVINKPDWVLSMLEKHEIEKERKKKAKTANRATKRGRGPAPVSKFEPQSPSPYTDSANHNPSDPYFS